jgi:signal transduction histidine kinase
VNQRDGCAVRRQTPARHVLRDWRVNCFALRRLPTSCAKPVFFMAPSNQVETAPSPALSDLIDRSRAEIERRWLERVLSDVSLAPGVELTYLRDGLPDYLNALVHVLARPEAAGMIAGAEDGWAQIAREHGVTRVRMGFDISQLVHEFVALRRVISEMAAEEALTNVRAEALLADALDSAIAGAVGAYLDARDHQTRQRQAEGNSFLTQELQNLLSMATMAASQLRNKASTSDQLKALGTLDRTHQHLSDLIQNLRVTESLESGTIEPHPAEIELQAIMSPALEAAQLMAQRKGVAFAADYDPKLRIEVDPLLTRSAIQNIADDAAKHTDQGNVDVTVEVAPEQFVVHVRDSRNGLSPVLPPTSFEPLQRGTAGLGSELARRAIEAQGGMLQTKFSEDNEGCHVWISMPRRPHTPAPPNTN